MKKFWEFGKFIHSIQLDGRELPLDLRHDILNFARDGIEADLPIQEFDSGVLVKPMGQTTFSEAPRYKLGSASRKELIGVLPNLVLLVDTAIAITTQDFTVYDGIRTLKEQAAYVKAGTSKTMTSLHLPQKDGFGHAVDLVPWIGGKPVWDWDGCYAIALAVDEAATRLGFAHNIVWGGAWDRRLSDFGGSADAYKKEVQLYRNRHAGSDFIDGPHFEWRD